MLLSLRSTLGRLFVLPKSRPFASLCVLGLAILTSASLFYGYAIWQWRHAVADVKAGRVSDAAERINLCLRVWSSDANVHRLAARIARMNGDFPAVEDHLNVALKLENGATEPTQLEFLLMRSQTGELDEVAHILYSFIEREHPDSAMILETIARAYMHNLQFGPAYASLNRWISIDSNNARAHHYRAWVLERMDQPQKALEDYLRALEIDPTLDRVRLRVGEMYLEDKDPLQALPHLNLLLERDPNRPEAQARLGQCKFLQGDLKEARRLLEMAATALPNDNPLLLTLARLDISDDQPVVAEKRLRHALAVDSSDTECRFTLLTALRMQGRETDAAAELAEYQRQKDTLERANKLLQAEAKNPSRDPQSAYEIGALLLRIKHENQGMHWMDEALTRNPNHRPTHEFLRDYFEKTGNENRAAFHRRKLSEQ